MHRGVATRGIWPHRVYKGAYNASILFSLLIPNYNSIRSLIPSKWLLILYWFHRFPWKVWYVIVYSYFASNVTKWDTTDMKSAPSFKNLTQCQLLLDMGGQFWWFLKFVFSVFFLFLSVSICLGMKNLKYFYKISLRKKVMLKFDD